MSEEIAKFGRRQMLAGIVATLSGTWLLGYVVGGGLHKGQRTEQNPTSNEREWERFSCAPNLTQDRIHEFLNTFKNADYHKVAEEARVAQQVAEGKNDQDLTIDALAKWYVACTRQNQTESQVDRGYVLSAGNIGIGHLLSPVQNDTIVDVTPLFRVKIIGPQKENRQVIPYIMARDSNLGEKGSVQLSAIPYEQGEGYSLFGTGVVAQGSNVGTFPNRRIADMKEIDAVLGEYKTGVSPAPMLLSEGKNPLQIMLYNMKRG